jgi:thiosulfate/3-mercaptopyruvate sulfurtransferase
MTVSSPLVSTQWLADHLGAADLVVVDATVHMLAAGYVSGHEQYILTGHIPGALFADLVADFSDPDGDYPFTRPDAARFETAAGALGIGNASTVVVYDSAVGQWASRLWWLFRAFGYDDVAVLDGGLTKWMAEARETDLGHVESSPASFAAAERPELWADKSDVESIVRGETDGALVCGIPPKEYTGELQPRGRAGHIPGSISVPAGRLVDRHSNEYLDEAGLRSAFAPVLKGSRIVTYCGGGIAAASDALALTLIGERNVAVYDGSLNEWAADPAAPLVTEP